LGKLLVWGKLLWPLIVGVVLLVIEYRTGFFQKTISGNTPTPTASSAPPSAEATALLSQQPLPTTTNPLPAAATIPAFVLVTNTSQPLPTSLPATNTSMPTNSPIPTTSPRPTPIPSTAPGSVLKDSEEWFANGWSLRVSNFNYDSLSQIHFTLTNHTDKSVVFPEIKSQRFKIVTDADETLIPCGDIGLAAQGGEADPIPQTKLNPNGRLEWTWSFAHIDPDYYSRGSGYPCWRVETSVGSATRNLTLIVEDVEGVITNARWEANVPRP
jgi:hypothetical protein